MEGLSSEITSLLGSDTEFEGKLAFLGTVRLDGRFKGEIRSSDTLVVGEGAQIEATIHVRILIVNGGLLKGTVKAEELVEIHAPGVVEGEIVSPALVIDKGAVFRGTSKMPDIDETDPEAPNRP